MKALKVSVLFLAVCFCFVSCSSQSSKKAQAEQKIADALSKGMLAPAVDQLVKAAQSQGRKVDADQIGKIIEKHSKEGASKTIALLDNGAIDTIASMQTFNFNNFGPILDKLTDQKNKQVIIGLITEMGNNCGREVGQTLEASK